MDDSVSFKFSSEFGPGSQTQTKAIASFSHNLLTSELVPWY